MKTVLNQYVCDALLLYSLQTHAFDYSLERWSAWSRETRIGDLPPTLGPFVPYKRSPYDMEGRPYDMEGRPYDMEGRPYDIEGNRSKTLCFINEIACRFRTIWKVARTI